MQIGNGEFWRGDCLDLMHDIPDGSVDMVLCDLPYGTTACKWDSVIPFEPLWQHYWRITKPNAAIVLTASQPFTTALISSQIDRFKYCWVWVKSKATGHLNVKKRPLVSHEDVCVFSTSQTPYFPQGLVKKDTPTVSKGNRGRKGEGSSGEVYGKAIKDAVQTHTGYPKSIIPFNVDMRAEYHPTQKPVALFEYLIKTYTNPGDTVLDNTAGSGTTAIAAERSGRKWLCIEQEETYYNKAIGRVWGEVLGL